MAARHRLLSDTAAEAPAALRRGGRPVDRTWDSPGLLLRRDEPASEFRMPEEGGITRMGSMAIPSGAQNVERAHATIDAMLQPEIGGLASLDTGTNSCAEGARANSGEVYAHRFAEVRTALDPADPRQCQADTPCFAPAPVHLEIREARHVASSDPRQQGAGHDRGGCSRRLSEREPPSGPMRRARFDLRGPAFRRTVRRPRAGPTHDLMMRRGGSSPRSAGNLGGSTGLLRGGSDGVGGLVFGCARSCLTASIWRRSNSVKRTLRQRSAARVMAPNMSSSTGRST